MRPDRLYIELKTIFRLAANYSKLTEAKTNAMKLLKNGEHMDTILFSIIGFLTSDKDGHTISSINHYSTFFKHKEVLKDKFESYKYGEYGTYSELEAIGSDRYCNDIYRVARDPKTLHNTKLKIRDKANYKGEQIQQGDIIKIGRIKFKIRKYRVGQNSPTNRRAQVQKVASPKNQEKIPISRQSNIINKTYKKEMFVQANEEIPP
jgi:hypothetical protein